MPTNYLGPGARGDLAHPEYDEAQFLAEGGGGSTPPGQTPRSLTPFVDAWLTGVHYEPGQIVTSPAGALTKALTQHDSGVYATDLAAGKWVEFAGSGGGAGGLGALGALEVSQFYFSLVPADTNVTAHPKNGSLLELAIDSFDPGSTGLTLDVDGKTVHVDRDYLFADYVTDLWLDFDSGTPADFNTQFGLYDVTDASVIYGMVFGGPWPGGALSTPSEQLGTTRPVVALKGGHDYRMVFSWTQGDGAGNVLVSGTAGSRIAVDRAIAAG